MTISQHSIHLDLPAGANVALGVTLMNFTSKFSGYNHKGKICERDIRYTIDGDENPENKVVVREIVYIRKEGRLLKTPLEGNTKEVRITAHVARQDSGQIVYKDAAVEKSVTVHLPNLSVLDINYDPNIRLRGISQRLLLCINPIIRFMENHLARLVSETTREIVLKFAAVDESELSNFKGHIRKSLCEQKQLQKQVFVHILNESVQQKSAIEMSIKKTVKKIQSIENSMQADSCRVIEKEFAELKEELQELNDDLQDIEARILNISEKIPSIESEIADLQNNDVGALDFPRAQRASASRKRKLLE